MSSTKISIDTVRHVAKLAALALSADEEQRMQAELNSILAHMSELDALDVSAVAPTFHVASEQAPLRTDAIVPSIARSELLATAPSHQEGGFAVPKVMDVEG